MTKVLPINKGWEERFAKFQEFPPEVLIRVPFEAYELMSEDEADRVGECLAMVHDIAAKLAMNMVKGAIKYVEGDHTLREWFDCLGDDAADSLNYVYLARDRARKDGLDV